MNEQQALAKMIPPGQPRPSKYRQGVIQIWVTRACDKACFNCTQGSNIGPLPQWDQADKEGYSYITPEQFEVAVLSLKTYWGVVGMFGGNPAMHPQFDTLCSILSKHIAFPQRGIWCNHPLTPAKAQLMRKTFNPGVSNLNVHMDQQAYNMFKANWPEARVVGLQEESRHSPPWVAMKDVLKKQCKNGVICTEEGCPCGGYGYIYDESKAWELISDCDINKYWSAMIGVFRGQVRAWFCEIAGAQAMLHQHETNYPDTGVGVGNPTHGYCVGPQFNEYNKREGLPTGHTAVDTWWNLPMQSFSHQVRKHCFECGVPLRAHGELSQSTDPESRNQVSASHMAIYKPKKGQRVELVTVPSQLGPRLGRFTDYLGNSRK